MFGRNGRYRFAFGGLVLALLLVGHSVGQPTSNGPNRDPAPKQQSADPKQAVTEKQTQPPTTTCDGSKPGEGDDLCYERRGVEAAEQQAAEAANAGRMSAKSFWLGVLQAGATVLSVFFTGWAALAAAHAARSAKQAVDVIPILERAYPFIVIEEETIQRSLSSYAQDNTIVTTSVGPTPKLRFSVKNYGRTPARILDIVGHFRIVRTPPTIDSGDKTFIPYESMLATGDKTDPPFEVSLDHSLVAADYLAIHNGTATIWFTGWISYRDMWGKDDSAMFAWRWNARLKKLVLSKDKAPD